MKRRLLLYLGQLDPSRNIATASTLAWLAGSQNALFDAYYDSYHQGIHFPGGDARRLEPGQLTGGTVSGDRHFEEFYFSLLQSDVCVTLDKDSLFRSSLANLGIPVAASLDRLPDFYEKVFGLFGAALPPSVVMLGTRFPASLAGLVSYFYPEIVFRRALGVTDLIPEQELAEICPERGRIFCVCVDDSLVGRLRRNGYQVEVVDRVGEGDDYLSLTTRLAGRWESRAAGWLVGDPTLVSHWLPTASEENLVAVYSVPQEKVIHALGDAIASKGRVVFGRQDQDKDFFDLSKLGQCFQVIDPCRPPFQSVRHLDYAWPADVGRDGFFEPEFSDDELLQFARQGRILVSLMFWTGMIREVANLHNLMDLFAITRLKCGLVLTAQSFEYAMRSPLELLTIPVGRGGVFPLVEPVLGSCGVGVGIESLIGGPRLAEDLEEAISRILGRVGTKSLLPRGWWPTLDTDLVKPNLRQKPKPLRFMKSPPYFEVRFNAGKRASGEDPHPEDPRTAASVGRSAMGRAKDLLRRAGLAKHFVPYRPYEGFRPGPLREDIVKAVKSAGLAYMFTKAEFNSPPTVPYLDDEFLALNFTAGRWDGWTPFETVNEVSDLETAERALLKRKRPGWLVSTIDSCLWVFGGEIWRRGTGLFEIARFCAQGGKSGKLVNVRPHTVARYARIIADLDGWKNA